MDAQPRYFFINTDSEHVDGMAINRWLDLGLAGANEYESAEEPGFVKTLAKLAENDILLAYENGVGLVAVGRVRHAWDGEVWADPLIWQKEGLLEGRVQVEWLCDMRNQPLSAADFVKIFGYQPRSTLQPINRHRETAAKLVSDLLRRSGKPVAPGSAGHAKPEAASAHEGMRQLLKERLHTYRNSSIVDLKKRAVMAEKGALACEVCGFDFARFCLDLGEGVCEVHHLRPLAEHQSGVTTSLDDLAIVCSNCHTLLHRAQPVLAVDALREMVLVL